MRSPTSSHLFRAALCLLVIALTSPAYATTFYVALDTLTDTCRIMVTQPDGETMKKLNGSYASYDEADAAMRKLEECSA